MAPMKRPAGKKADKIKKEKKLPADKKLKKEKPNKKVLKKSPKAKNKKGNTVKPKQGGVESPDDVLPDEEIKKPSKAKKATPKQNITESLTPPLGGSWLQRPSSRFRKDTEAYSRPPGTTNRAWAKCLVQMAPGLAQMPAGSQVVFNVWSDCAGMSSEMSGLEILCQEINAQYSVNFVANLVGACDKSSDSQLFVEKNFNPKILSGDINKRTVIKDQAYDYNLKTKEHAEMSPIDVHVMGFPCTPWSGRGSGKGFADPNAKPFFVGLSTVKVVKPKVFVWECVEGVATRSTSQSSDGSSDLDVLQGHLREQLGDSYTLLILRNMSPLRMGFPMNRPRRGWKASNLFFRVWEIGKERKSGVWSIFGSKGMASKHSFTQPQQTGIRFYVLGILRPHPGDLQYCQEVCRSAITRMSQMLPEPVSLFQFLGIQPKASIPWDLLHTYPSREAGPLQVVLLSPHA